MTINSKIDKIDTNNFFEVLKNFSMKNKQNTHKTLKTQAYKAVFDFVATIPQKMIEANMARSDFSLIEEFFHKYGTKKITETKYPPSQFG